MTALRAGTLRCPTASTLFVGTYILRTALSAGLLRLAAVPAASRHAPERLAALRTGLLYEPALAANRIVAVKSPAALSAGTFRRPLATTALGAVSCKRLSALGALTLDLAALPAPRIPALEATSAAETLALGDPA